MNIQKTIIATGITTIVMASSGAFAETSSGLQANSGRTVSTVNFDTVSNNIASTSSYKWTDRAYQDRPTSNGGSWSQAVDKKPSYKWASRERSSNSGYAKSSGYEWGTRSYSEQQGLRWGHR